MGGCFNYWTICLSTMPFYTYSLMKTFLRAPLWLTVRNIEKSLLYLCGRQYRAPFLMVAPDLYTAGGTNHSIVLHTSPGPHLSFHKSEHTILIKNILTQTNTIQPLDTNTCTLTWHTLSFLLLTVRSAFLVAWVSSVGESGLSWYKVCITLDMMFG